MVPPENSTEDSGEDDPPPPEPTRIPVDESLSVLEYESFFLIIYGKAVFYIVPKDGFTEPEQDILRNLRVDSSEQEV